MEKMRTLYDKLKSQLPGLELREQEPLRLHTTFRVGGPAALMACPESTAELKETLNIARACGIAPFLLGRGSNLLAADEGVNAFIVKTAGVKELELLPGDRIRASAGVGMAQLAMFAAENRLAGLAFAHGIPGTLGGGIFMNAGAYGGELVQVLEEVTFLDENGTVQTRPAGELELGYRHSIFSTRPWAILEAVLRLTPGDKDTILAEMADLAQRRRDKQPLELPSAGSTFKRPEGHFAGGLIEQAGLKGTMVGGAQVSEKHAGFIVNAGGATCADILGLIRLVRETVFRESGVMLEPEVRMLGCTLE